MIVMRTSRQTREIAVIMRAFILCGLVLGRVACAGAPAAAPAGALPDAEGAIAAYFAARSWLDGNGAGAAPATPPDVRSAAVVLRLRGRLAGFGKDAGTEGAPGAVARALAAALDDARTRRSEERAAAGEAGLGPLLSLELELAGPREPMIGRTFDEVARAMEPGEFGLQLVDGTRTAYEPASHLLARRMASPVSRAILSMVTDLGLPPRDLAELRELGGSTAIYAVPSLRLAQRDPAAPPFTLARGLPFAPGGAPLRQAAREACGRVAMRLAEQLRPVAAAEGLPPDAAAQIRRTGLRGDYVIPADRFEPFAAGPFEQSLTAWALARAASTASWPAPLRTQAHEAAAAILAALADVDPSEREPTADPSAVAFALLAIAELPASPADGPAAVPEPFVRALDGALARLLQPAALATLRPPVRAAVLDAAAARASAGTATLDATALRTALDAAWEETPVAELPLVAPVLLDAERRAGGADAPARIDARRARLEAARTVLVGTQVPDAQPGRSPSVDDAAGAFPLSGSTAGRVSAQSARAHAFVAMLAGMPGTRSPTRDAEDIEAMVRGTRFIAQLVAPADVAYCAPTPARAVGGVLASPADLSQPVVAQAIALLALVETERAAARLGLPDAPPPGPPAAPAEAAGAPARP